MRTYGKDFEQYYNGPREHHGRYINSPRAPLIEPTGDGDLEIFYVSEDGQITSEVFNLVVLSVGFQVSQGALSLLSVWDPAQ